MRKGELEAQAIDTRPFDDTRLPDTARHARAVTEQSRQEFAPRLQDRHESRNDRSMEGGRLSSDEVSGQGAAGC